MKFSLVALMGLVSWGMCIPIDSPGSANATETNTLVKRAKFSCDKLVEGLSRDDCNHMAKIDMAGQGENSKTRTAKGIWVGKDGHTKFKFSNKSKGRVALVVWNNPEGDYESSFMNVRKPQVSWSLAAGQSLTVSLNEGVSGGFAGLYDAKTPLSPVGQVHQTWGEFTTGQYATIDVSREVRMDGDKMWIQTPIGCVSDMDRCVFVCKDGKNTCGEKDTYELKDCQPGSQPGANYGERFGQPEGGCQGFDKGGEVAVHLL
ncbi:hypothetical protein PpBr36_02334 [Pyricularia pennisetigena]|uniref:hypothetical protein n=1 Tax=Pyricularia pennisetigena TaxID=1578925 RepID=UPI00114F47C5|nr:hypothetical protein PpBr36_02334 [Pyricularia pennisetigena]TLS31282.1 hypothetical protein PpBr36_02334 [Pyricularia pennisetigena]